MTVSRQQKAEILVDLRDKFGRQKGAVIVGYKGTNVKDMSKFRNAARASGLDYRVAKKNLVKMAAKEKAGVELQDDVFNKLPFGILFGYEDQMAPCKVSAKFAKDLDTMEILAGIIDGKLVGKDVVMQYAILPSKEELYAKFVGLLRAPLTNFHGILNSGLSGFARALTEYAKTKEA